MRHLIPLSPFSSHVGMIFCNANTGDDGGSSAAVESASDGASQIGSTTATAVQEHSSGAPGEDGVTPITGATQVASASSASDAIGELAQVAASNEELPAVEQAAASETAPDNAGPAAASTEAAAEES